MSVKDACNEHYFVSDHDDVSRNDQLFRFLLHLWFTENAGLITGHSNQIEMPAYLAKIIRSVRPEENGKHTCCKKNNYFRFRVSIQYMTMKKS